MNGTGNAATSSRPSLIARRHVNSELSAQARQPRWKSTARNAIQPRVTPTLRAHGVRVHRHSGQRPRAEQWRARGSLVRLRDARSAVSPTRKSRSPACSCFAVDPGNYVVELISNDQTVLAASRVNVNAGQPVSAVVRMPFRIHRWRASSDTARGRRDDPWYSHDPSVAADRRGAVVTTTPDMSPR